MTRTPLFVLLILFVGLSHSAIIKWVGTTNGDWFEPAFWDLRRIPLPTDDVQIISPISLAVILRVRNGGALTVKSLTLGQTDCPCGIGGPPAPYCRNELFLRANLTVTETLTVQNRGALSTEEPIVITAGSVNFGGSVNIGGTINSPQVTCSGVLSPYKTGSFALLTINGDFEFSGTLHFDLGGYDANINADFIQVNGNFSIPYADFIFTHFVYPFAKQPNDILVLWDAETTSVTQGSYKYNTNNIPSPPVRYYNKICEKSTELPSGADCKGASGGSFAVVISPSSTQCPCPLGYTGTTCNILNCPGNPDCYGHGACIDNYPDLPTCDCFPGWKGTACTFNDCPGTPDCLNHGICNSTYQCTCKSGWTGVDCSIGVCPGTPQCSGRGTCSTAYDPPRCECQSGWGGTICSENLTVVACPNDCSGHGTCNNRTGQCYCINSFTGSDCSIPKCFYQCSQYGACTALPDGNMCVCQPGWKGPDCTTFYCPGSPECSAKGRCSKSFNPPQCVCDYGWGDSDCSRNLTVVQCQNNCTSHGTCNLSNGQCTCDSGWTDNACSTALCGGSSTCSYHGVCSTASGVNQCICRAGWSGSQCEIAVCENSCSGNGACLDTVDPPKCDCNVGYSGGDCSIRLADGTCPENCFGRGTCNNGVCACDPNFDGADCSIPLCAIPCSTHGQCTVGSPNYCVCDEKWVGRDCSQAQCPGVPECSGKGVCVSTAATPFCDCNVGWGGDNCSVDLNIALCDNNCNGNGLCDNGECICSGDWTGQWCSVPLCYNGDQHCSFHGNCTTQPGDLPNQCVCDIGWKGNNCEIADCPGEPDCTQRGECLTVDSFVQCKCDIGWGGPDCALDLVSTRCNNNCSFHGNCVEGKCQCFGNYTGFDCSAVVCSPDVKCIQGYCSLDGSGCTCYPGYGERDCSKAICLNDCSGAGSCTVVNGEGICDCNFGKGGQDCSENIQESPEGSGKDVPVGLIIGVVVGGVAVIIIGMVVVTLIRRRERLQIEKDLSVELHATK